MKVLCFGSLNIDFTYSVDHFVCKGETLNSAALNVYSGGKGLNQAIALAHAGAEVYMAGAVGTDGAFLLNTLNEQGVDVRHVRTLPDVRTGNAIIQTDKQGDNCILLYGGANRAMRRTHMGEVISAMDAGDILLIQNEINELDYLIRIASARGMKIVLNPSPMDAVIATLPLELVNTFLLNEVEAKQMTGIPSDDYDTLLSALAQRFPHAEIVLTVGEKGSLYRSGELSLRQAAYPVSVVDTTAAGDTFTGYFLSSLCRGITPTEALNIASMASAIACTRAGAAPSIPDWETVMEHLNP